MEITGLITAIIFGLVIGGLGRLVAPGRNQVSLLVTLCWSASSRPSSAPRWPGSSAWRTRTGIDWTELALQIVFAGGGVLLLSRSPGPPAPVANLARCWPALWRTNIPCSTRC